MSERLEGNVAAILNERELVLNIGAAQGVRRGMMFAVLNRRGMAITDPVTGEDLGSVEVPKVLVRAVRVQERTTVARTFRKEIRGGLYTNLFSARTVADIETLRAADKPYQQEIGEEESYVRRGDPVVQTSGEEFMVPEPSETGQ
jgi:hypothetical protein